MSELDILPIDVREATEYVDDNMAFEEDNDWTIIRSELLRVTAERDALRKKINESSFAKVRGKKGEFATVIVSHDLVGKRVALVVVD